MSSETAWTSLYISNQVSTGVLCSNLGSASREGHPATGSQFVVQDFSRYSSVLSNLNDLKRPPLKDHRRDIRLTFLFKIVTGRVAVQAEATLLPADGRTRHKHKHKYRYLTATCNQCLNSFFVKTIPDWNSLPEGCIPPDTVTALQSRLRYPP